MAGVEQKVKKYLEAIKKDNKRINAVLEINEHALEEARAVDAKKKKGRLYGYVIGVKSNINTKGLTASCASKTLENYKSTYDATVIERIRAEDGVVIGMLNCDEFACGFSGEFSTFGPTENPAVKGHVPGGSSSGSGAAVAAGFCDMALGSDTGGSIRVPASFCGVVGVKPSYGCVSRHGLIDLSMSLDQIGPIARTVEEAALLLDVIRGKDEHDTTTFETSSPIHVPVKSLRIGTIAVDGVDKRIQGVVDKIVTDFGKKGKHKIGDIALGHIDLAIETYHPLVWTEFFSATRRFDGRRYGLKIEESAGREVLRRIYGGSEIAKAEFAGRYYHKAREVKELIKQEFERVLEDVDCIIMPTVPILPWKIGAKMSIEALYAVDALTIPSNLAEVCAVSIPVGQIDGKPVGMQVICAKGNEGKMMSIAREIEKLRN
jgi:aspartyl-tRNA(Asn)/glutamyl-tRNA(Gln) amidotransferase subunit A